MSGFPPLSRPMSRLGKVLRVGSVFPLPISHKVPLPQESPSSSGLWLLFFSLQLSGIPESLNNKTNSPFTPRGIAY